MKRLNQVSDRAAATAASEAFKTSSGKTTAGAEDRPDPSEGRHNRVLPTFEACGISWRTVAPGVVEIAVELVNPHDECTEASDLVIAAAPLGAFVPFKPVTRVTAPALQPGERRRVATRVSVSVLEDSPEPMVAKIWEPNGVIIQWIAAMWGIEPGELGKWMGSSEWLGNLDVHLEAAPGRHVEVHRALGIHVQAGRAAMMWMLVGEDASAKATSSDPLWGTEVRCMSGSAILKVQAPAEPGRRTRVVVEFTRAADGKVVPVEFEFETVEGPGDSVCGLGI